MSGKEFIVLMFFRENMIELRGKNGGYENVC